MKKLFTLFVTITLTISVFAQSPQKMTYQAVIRNASDALVTNHDIGMRISILQGSATGTPVYIETQNTTTNANGLATIEIGNGTLVTGAFSGINWANGTYYLKTETDPNGGTSYTITGTSQILSVPYALYAKTSGNGSLWSQYASNIYFNNGNVGIGTNSPREALEVTGNAIFGNWIAPVWIEVNWFGSGNRVAGIDFHGDDTYTDFGLRIMRENTGQNASSTIWHRGTGSLKLFNTEAAPIDFLTASENRMSIAANGNIGIGTMTPASKLDVMGEINVNSNIIVNVANPVNAQDAATR